jgi:two-component system CheB/CheR fusion protein
MSEAEQSKTIGAEQATGDIVVVGASAGGIEALSILVSTLPPDFPAPIVLAQHLDPHYPSSLGAILQRRTTLPVEVVTGSSELQPGKIYVAPSNRDVVIVDGRIMVEEDGVGRHKPSLDLLLSSAAQAYGDHVIAVILTGTGSDGAAGAVEVKAAGGTVIIQNPQTARYPSMPLALPPTIVDFEADIERIGPLLRDLLAGQRLPSSADRVEDVLRAIFEQVNRQASIDFRQYKTSTILRRIARRMAAVHCRTMRDYATYLAVHPEEVGELVQAFLINVTQFFRDPEAFNYLKSEILPVLIARAREHDRVLRFWSAGCATGEEPYSLAMVLTDLLGAELPEWSIKVFATDLDEVSINFARRGLYSENLLKGVPPEYRERFFERTDHGYRIVKTLRQMVIFGLHDLSRNAPFPHVNLIICRNVLIYFAPELQDYVLNQFAFSLAPDGYLFLGKAETIRPNQSYYELVNKQWRIYRCTGSPLPLTRRNLAELSAPATEGNAANRANRPASKQAAESDQAVQSFELSQLRRLNELLLRFLPIGLVVIDRSYRILTANGAARRFLGLRDVSNGQDFLHATRGIPYSVVRNAIDTVFRERHTVTLSEVELDMASGGNGRFVSLSIALMQMEPGAPDLAAISVTDVTEQVQTRRQLEAAQAEQAKLMAELSATNRRLSDMNKELLDANEELQITNEELVLTHEELQATIEEFETTNEELQATNEELETNNEELQATNEELETTNDELRARTQELQELAGMLESERVRLAEMVELAPFYIMVLRGPNLIVEAFNPRYGPLLEGRKIQDRPLEEVCEILWENGSLILRLAREAYQLDATRTIPRMPIHQPQANGTYAQIYLTYTIVPSHDAAGKVSGLVIYAVDETSQARQDAEEHEQLKRIFDNTDAVALGLYDAQTMKLILGNAHYLNISAHIHGLDRHTLVGRGWIESSVVTPGERAMELWNTALMNRTAVHLPELSVKFDEHETIWRWSLTPIPDSERPDMIQYMLASLVDITEPIRAGRAAEQAKPDH